MAADFTGAEIVELGVEIEKNGEAFYQNLAQQTKSNDAKLVFEFLAEEEKKHIQVFSDILKTVKEYEPQESYPDDYFAYMKDLASEHIFTQAGSGQELAQSIKDDYDAVLKALQFEMESVKFYEAMKQAVDKSQHGLIDALIEEEQKHIDKLNLFKSTY